MPSFTKTSHEQDPVQLTPCVDLTFLSYCHRRRYRSSHPRRPQTTSAHPCDNSWWRRGPTSARERSHLNDDSSRFLDIGASVHTESRSNGECTNGRTKKAIGLYQKLFNIQSPSEGGSSDPGRISCRGNVRRNNLESKRANNVVTHATSIQNCAKYNLST